MKILINDIIQSSIDAADELKSPALSDYYNALTTFNVSWNEPHTIDCVGIGYTDATVLTITNGIITRTINITQSYPYHNGLYLIESITTNAEYDYFTISHNGTYVGRIGMGMASDLCTNATKEIGWYTSSENRVSLSGQVLPGAGGFHGRRFEADVRYKIDDVIYAEIDAAYATQIKRGFPYFIYTEDEQHKLPTTMLRFYASTDNPISLLQSASYRFLYSYKFSFYERF